MGTSFIPLCVIIAVLIIAFLFASLPQVNHKTQYRVLYAIAIIMLLAVIPISIWRDMPQIQATIICLF